MLLSSKDIISHEKRKLGKSLDIKVGLCRLRQHWIAILEFQWNSTIYGIPMEFRYHILITQDPPVEWDGMGFGIPSGSHWDMESEL